MEPGDYQVTFSATQVGYLTVTNSASMLEAYDLMRWTPSSFNSSSFLTASQIAAQYTTFSQSTNIAQTAATNAVGTNVVRTPLAEIEDASELFPVVYRDASEGVRFINSIKFSDDQPAIYGDSNRPISFMGSFEGDGWSITNFNFMPGTGISISLSNGVPVFSATGDVAVPTNAIGDWILRTNTQSLYGASGFIQIGTNAHAGSQSAVVGSYKTGYLNSVVVQGFGNQNDVSVGAGSQAFTNTVAVGLNAWGTNRGVAVGMSAEASNSVAVGYAAKARARGGVAVGSGAASYTNNAIAIGESIENYVPGTANLQGLHLGTTTNWNVQQPYPRFSVNQNGVAHAGGTNGQWLRLATSAEAASANTNGFYPASGVWGGYSGWQLLYDSPSPIMHRTNIAGHYQGARDPGMVEHNGTLYCFYTGFPLNGENALAYGQCWLMTSTNQGYSWQSKGIIAATNETPYAPTCAITSPFPVIDANSNLWVFGILALYAMDGPHNGLMSIGAKIALAGTDWSNPASYTWVNGGAPLVPITQTWETNGTYIQGLYAPTVTMVNPSNYVMWYCIGGNGTWSIAPAVSTDLTNWTKLATTTNDVTHFNQYGGTYFEEPAFVRFRRGGTILLGDGFQYGIRVATCTNQWLTNGLQLQLRPMYGTTPGTNGQANWWTYAATVPGNVGSSTAVELSDGTILMVYSAGAYGDTGTGYKTSLGMARFAQNSLSGLGISGGEQYVRQTDSSVSLGLPISIGVGAVNRGTAGSSVIGHYSTAGANYAHAIGHASTANGAFDHVFGYNVFAYGNSNNVIAGYGIAIGASAVAGPGAMIVSAPRTDIVTNNTKGAMMFAATNGFQFAGSDLIVSNNILSGSTFTMRDSSGSLPSIFEASDSLTLRAAGDDAENRVIFESGSRITAKYFRGSGEALTNIQATNITVQVSTAMGRVSGSTSNAILDLSIPASAITLTNSVNWLHATNQLSSYVWREFLLKATNNAFTFSFPSGWTRMGPFTTNGVTLGASNGCWIFTTASYGVGATNVAVCLQPPNN
jgi:hypothetical protein